MIIGIYPIRSSISGPFLNKSIAICGVICGAETWTDVELFGNERQQWLEQFLELENGIPSHDTFGRVFARIDSDRLDLRLRIHHIPFGFLRQIQHISLFSRLDVRTWHPERPRLSRV